MRIVIAHSRLNTFGGGERATLELLRRLSRHHDVSLWAGNYAPDSTFAELQRYPREDIPPGGWAWRRPAADAVIAQTFGANLLALRHPRTLCYIHTMRSPYLDGPRPDYVARRVLERAAFARAAALLTNSDFTASRIAARYGRTAEVLPPGAEERYFDLPWQVGTYALYVGRLAPEKGLERVLRWSRDLTVDLWLVGDGDADYTAHLRALAGARIRFLGPLTGEALAQAYAASRYFVFLPHQEEFGIAALDAMAAGKPVIASAEGGLPSLVRDGETGYLVSTAEAFASASKGLLADDALCARLGTEGRNIARGYTWQRFSARIEALCARQV